MTGRLHICFSQIEYPEAKGVVRQTLQVAEALSAKTDVEIHGLVRQDRGLDLGALERAYPVKAGFFERRPVSGAVPFCLAEAGLGPVARLTRRLSSQIAQDDRILVQGLPLLSLARKMQHRTPTVFSLVDCPSRRASRLNEQQFGWRGSTGNLRINAFRMLERRAGRFDCELHVYSAEDRAALSLLGIAAKEIGLMPAPTVAMGAQEDVAEGRETPITILGNQAVPHVRAGTVRVLEALSGIVDLLLRSGEKVHVLGCGAERPNLSCFEEEWVTYTRWLPNLEAALHRTALVVVPDTSGSGPRNRTLQALQAGAAVAGFPDAFEGLPSDVPGKRIVFQTDQAIVPAITEFFDKNLRRSPRQRPRDHPAFVQLRKMRVEEWCHFLQLSD